MLWPRHTVRPPAGAAAEAENNHVAAPGGPSSETSCSTLTYSGKTYRRNGTGSTEPSAHGSTPFFCRPLYSCKRYGFAVTRIDHFSFWRSEGEPAERRHRTSQHRQQPRITMRTTNREGRLTSSFGEQPSHFSLFVGTARRPSVGSPYHE